MGNRAVFLDRDGTMAEDVHYCSRPEDFHLFPNATKAIKLLNEYGFKVIVITNQSGIARGYFNEVTLTKIHEKMKKELAREGAWVDAIYYCPHHPDENCDCRKPKPKLLLQAAKDFDIDLEHSFMVGDLQTDIHLGEAVGCKTILVGGISSSNEAKPDAIVSDILEATRTILQYEAKKPLISVVIPARNAERLLSHCLESLKELDYPKDKLEVIIADGLSTDRTREIAGSYGARVITDFKNSVVSARNVGFGTARGKLIAFSDADCVMDKNWLKNCLKYFDNEWVAGVGGPNLVPQNESSFGKAVGLIFDYAFYISGAAPTRVFDKVIESRAHGSNAIYRADVLRKIMPVDESIIAGEDVMMNEHIKNLGYKLLYVPDVVVYHSRRPTPRKWWHQMYKYGLGRALLHRKKTEALSPAHVVAGLTIPILLVICAVLITINPWLLLAVAGVAILLSAFTAVFTFFKTTSLVAATNMPLVLSIFLIAWSCGFLSGLIRKDLQV